MDDMRRDELLDRLMHEQLTVSEASELVELLDMDTGTSAQRMASSLVFRYISTRYGLS